MLILLKVKGQALSNDTTTDTLILSPASLITLNPEYRYLYIDLKQY